MTSLVLKKMEIIRDEKFLVKLFNKTCINFMEISGKNPSSFGNCAQDDAIVVGIISKYSPHLSFQKIKRRFSPNKVLELAYAKAKDMNQIIISNY